MVHYLTHSTQLAVFFLFKSNTIKNTHYLSVRVNFKRRSFAKENKKQIRNCHFIFPPENMISK